VSSSVKYWIVEMKADDGSLFSVSWIPLYRASLSECRAADFHRTRKCVAITENGRIAASYNEDDFNSVDCSCSPKFNGFIVSVADDGGCGEIFYRNENEVGVVNCPLSGPVFGGYPFDQHP
jgi:hypothetical protein